MVDVDQHVSAIQGATPYENPIGSAGLVPPKRRLVGRIKVVKEVDLNGIEAGVRVRTLGGDERIVHKVDKRLGRVWLRGDTRGVHYNCESLAVIT